MAGTFIDESFLLRTPTARRLYHTVAANLPIIDFHSHLDARMLADDRALGDLTELWIAPDQYKHRAMRLMGVPEREITGDAPPREKFARWAETLPQTLGNPLFHWSALELQRAFGITEFLAPGTADEIWARTRTCLGAPTHTARQFLTMAGVELVCTSDRWLDDLSAHVDLARSVISTRVLPSLRADDALAIDEPDFAGWVSKLSAATGERIEDLDGYLHALSVRLDAFAAAGCCVTDHGIDRFDYRPAEIARAAIAFRCALKGETLEPAASNAFRSYLLLHLAESYGRRGWVMQLHLGAQRRTSSRLRRLVGGAGGFAAIGATTDIAALCQFLDDVERRDALPRTILYNLNPADTAAFASLTGSFSEDGVATKIQLGPAWWFNDHALGIRQHFDAIAHIGLLSTFVGMTTDSRSLLSMSRHEYFRRLLCDYLGEKVKSGAFPDDLDLLGSYVRRIAYENARAWLPVSSVHRLHE
jgi:glucuronate isomerase